MKDLSFLRIFRATLAPQLSPEHRRYQILREYRTYSRVNLRFFTNVKEHAARKRGKYNSTIDNLKKTCKKVIFMNLNMSALGLMCRSDDESGLLQELKSIGLLELQSKNNSRHRLDR